MEYKYLKPHTEFELDFLLESISINESNINSLEKSLNRSDNKLKWYKQLIFKIKNMRNTIKHRVLIFVIPLLLSSGISQGSIISTTNDIMGSEMNNTIEQVFDLPMDMGDTPQEKSGITTYFDTTKVFLAFNASKYKDYFEKTVEYDNTELYYKVYFTGNSATPEITVTLNGNQIFYDNGSKVALTPHEDTVVANKGDIIKISIFTNSQNPGRYGLYLDMSMSADIYSSVDEITKDNFKIFPNPVQNSLNITTNSYQDINYEVYSMDGKMTTQGRLNDINTSIDVSNLQSGYYIIKLISDKGVVSKRFMKR